MAIPVSQRAILAFVSLGALFSGVRLVGVSPSLLQLMNVSAAIGWASVVIGAAGLFIAALGRTRG
jgi:hypothetical protein